MQSINIPRVFHILLHITLINKSNGNVLFVIPIKPTEVEWEVLGSGGVAKLYTLCSLYTQGKRESSAGQQGNEKTSAGQHSEGKSRSVPGFELEFH